ncbi:MAG: LLM class flavin-dependent oxidoreductase [Rhodospirillaceae bacterium]|nr:LLM class flavin-dependent oxidoreductase [Rhodospirillaceae bacterium]
MTSLTFGFTAAAAATGNHAQTDAARYTQMLADTKLGYSLGFDCAWVLEHHFTDYFPTPSPIVVMSHLAAACPGLSLGSCVIVAPWYHPLRLAEEIAMLSHFCSGDLHLAFGRGTAKIEYDAFDVDMSTGKGRLRETMQIIEKAFSGQPIAHEGEHYKIGREVALRPEPNLDRIHFYGAVGSRESATGNADMGMPVLLNTQFPPFMLEKVMSAWQARADQLGLKLGGDRPISTNCVIADSDEEARETARGYMAAFFALQADHYEADADHWKDIEGYQQFSKTFGNLRKMADPANLDGFMDNQLIGAPATVAGKLEMYRDMGFDHFILNCAREGWPAELRETTMRRFAKEVAPGFKAKQAAQ